MTTPLYRLERLEKRYPGREQPVLSIDAMDVAQGECLALVGPSGAGKSTLLRLLHFLEAPTAGTIAFEGQPAGFPVALALRRRISMVFQRPELLHGSVQSNVEYGLSLRGHRDPERIAHVMQELGLTKLAPQETGSLSGGEMQRVALARVLALDPRVLLLDEPTANLDPHNVALIEERLQAVRAAGTTTIILVTHHLPQARRLADRVGLLLDGSLCELAPTERFFEQPQDPRTRAFVGGEMIY